MTLAGLPHSEIPGSMRACRSPRHIAACHVLLRLSVPRHPPSTLSNLTIKCLDLMRSAFPTFAYEHRCAFFYLPVFNCQRIVGVDALKTEQERQEVKTLLELTLETIPFDLRCIIATPF